MKGMLCTVAPTLPLLLLLFTCGLSVSALSVLSSPSTIHLDSLTLAECCGLNLEVARRGRTEEGILEEGIEEERRRGGGGALKTIAAALKATHVGWISVFVGSGGRGGRGASNALVAKDTLERNPISVGGINSLQKELGKHCFCKGEERRKRGEAAAVITLRYFCSPKRDGGRKGRGEYVTNASLPLFWSIIFKRSRNGFHGQGSEFFIAYTKFVRD